MTDNTIERLRSYHDAAEIQLVNKMNNIGPQKEPATPARLKAQQRQLERELQEIEDASGPRCNDCGKAASELVATSRGIPFKVCRDCWLGG